jgi:hypothetical protein
VGRSTMRVYAATFPSSIEVDICTSALTVCLEFRCAFKRTVRSTFKACVALHSLSIPFMSFLGLSCRRSSSTTCPREWSPMSAYRNSVFVAADVNGVKVNVQFFFDQYGPSTAQLLSRSHEAFQRIFAVHHVNRTFAVSHAVVFNEYTQAWDRLERSAQLTHNCQVYLFQPDTLDIPGEIPPPISSYTLLGGYESPTRDYSNSPRAPAPSTSYSYTPVTYTSPYTSTQPRHLPLDTAPVREIQGPSLLAEERQKVESTLRLPLDEHRDSVRREVTRFSDELSPQRRQT